MYPLTLLYYSAIIIKCEHPEEECNWLATKTGHGPNCMYQYKIDKGKKKGRGLGTYSKRVRVRLMGYTKERDKRLGAMG